MKNKGFTLVEMMTVLVILSLLIGIGIFTVNNIQKGASENYYHSMEDTLKIAGNDYFTDNRGDRPIDDYNYVTLETLQDHEYLERLRTYDKKSNCDSTSGVFIYNTDDGTDYEVCLKCGDFSSDGPYCTGNVPGQIMITGKTDTGRNYNPLLSYIGAPWAKASSVDITFKINDASINVTKYEIYNSNNNSLFDTCNVTSGKSCTEKISASGSFYVMAYDDTTKVANRKYFNVKLDNTKPTFDFKDREIVKDLGEGFEYKYINEIINIHDDNGYKSVTYTLENLDNGTKYAADEDITENNLEILHNLPSGRYKLSARVTDYAGNYLDDSIEFQVQYTVNLVFFDNNELKHEVGSIKVYTGGKYSDLQREVRIGSVDHTVEWYDNSSLIGNTYSSETEVAKSSMHTLYGKETRNVIEEKDFPTCNNLNDFTYNGVNQELVSAKTGYTLTNNIQKNAGTYTIIAMPDPGYVWKGGTRTYKIIQCTIKKYSVTVTAVNQEKIYDGTPLNANTECTITDMPENHTHSCTHSGSQTNVGTSTKTITNVTIKQGSTVETSNFEITQVNGTLKVTPRIIRVRADDQTKTYDGLPLNADTTCTVTSEMQVAPNQRKACTNTGTITLAGTTPKVLEEVIITDKDGNNVTSNYQITRVNGILKINKKEITVTATNQSKIYDGTALNASTTCSASSLGRGDRIACTNSGTKTDVGTATKTLGNITITNKDGTDVTTSCYIINKENGTLTVTVRVVTIKATDQEKIYDGTALNADSTCSTTVGSIAPNQTLTCTTSGSITEIGEVPKVLESTSIKNSSGNSVKSNYEITEENGKLTVKLRSITIKCDDQSKTYDGTALTATNDCSVTSTVKLMEGDSISCTCSGSRTDAGETTKTITAASVTHPENYNVTKANGKITINKRAITVKCDDKSGTYNGSALSATNNCSVTSSTGVISGHSVSCTCTGSKTNAGTETITTGSVSVSSGDTSKTDNYNISTTNGTITVSAKSVAVSWGSTTSWTYDGNEHAPTASATTGVSGETMNVTRTTEKTTGSHSSTASCSSVTGGQASCANYTLTNTTQAFTITSPPPSHPPDATSCDTWWYSYSGYCVDTSTGYNYQTTHTDKGKKGKSAASTACENYNPCTSPYTEQNPTCNVYVQWGIGYYSEGKTKSGGPYATRDAAVNACKSHNPCWITCG